MTSTPEVDSSGVARDRELVLRTLDMVIPGRSGSYLAAPISTGRRLLRAMSEEVVNSPAELVSKIGVDEYLNRVRWPNVQDSEHFANHIRSTGVRYLINSAPMWVRTWIDQDYLELSFTILATKVRNTYFHPEWAYSKGAIEEFFFCLGAGIEMIGPDGSRLTAESAFISLNEVKQMTLDLQLKESTSAIERSLARLAKAESGGVAK